MMLYMESYGFVHGRGGQRQPLFVDVHSVPNDIKSLGLFSVRDRHSLLDSLPSTSHALPLIFVCVPVSACPVRLGSNGLPT